MTASPPPDELERLRRERDFFRRQSDDLGARVLRLQEEQGRAHRDARRWRTTARIIGEAYKFADIDTKLDAVATRILVAILDNFICDRAAFVCGLGAGQVAIEQALGYREEPQRAVYDLAAPPPFACVSSRTPLSAEVAALRDIIGLPFLLWSFDAKTGYGLIVGARSEVNVARPFEAEDRPVVEGALGVFLDLREKDALLKEKAVLADELQHRVRNNLQVVYGMLSNELDRRGDAAGKDGIGKIARRVLTMAQVYDHVLGREMSRMVNFGAYLEALCISLAEFHAEHLEKIVLVCRAETVFVDLDTVTSLGLVVAELVSNSYEHAFPDGAGGIEIELRAVAGGRAQLTVRDDGRGLADGEGRPGARRGLGLVRRLARQIHAGIDLRTDPGTVWTLDFAAAPSAVPSDA